MSIDPLVAVDFETDGIEDRPNYPPEPRGVAIQVEGGPGRYVKGDRRELRRALEPYWGKRPMVFHNSAFDLAVGVEKLELPMPKWEHVHDTLFLCFLADPFAPSLSLKPSAERYLSMPPDEQADLKAWILANVPEARRAKKSWGKWIAKAPYEILAPYAVGDTARTLGLHARLTTESVAASYRRERRLVGGLIENSATGVVVDRARLDLDLPKYEAALVTTDKRLWKLLGRKFNVDSGEELADALEWSGKGSGFLQTATGRRSVSKGSLAQAEIDPTVRELLDYRGRLETALSTFLRNWHAAAERDGRMHFDWHQTRGDFGGGARTGRLSSSPNCQNIPKELPARAPRGLPDLPRLRSYLLPEPGHVWVRKDYSQQELRLLAHFEDGLLLQLYLDNPRIDIHQQIADELAARGFPIGRREAKTLAFAMLYGMGLTELATRLGCSIEQAKSIRNAYLALLPGIAKVNAILKQRAKANEPYKTWGGRKYYCEPPRFVDGKMATYEYKMLNYLIQGSAADVTKEALGLLFEAAPSGRFLCTVHDEINWSVPKSKLKRVAKELDEIMRSVQTDVPMESDTEIGGNWGELQTYKV
jgi:DNA polymerase I-like protein with 3'-5' exonuclease and polymerase domains